MQLPFSIEQFLKLFAQYNQAVWPLQVVFYLLAIFAILAPIKESKFSDKLIGAIFSLLWIWMGVVYHIIYFSSINKAAYIFGTAFIFQGLLFLYYAFIKKSISFRYSSN